MGIGTLRRHYRRRYQNALARGDEGVAAVFEGKRLAEPGTPLPDGFPARELLVENRYETLEDLAGVTVTELIKIKGIGRKTAEQILAALE